MRPHDFFHMSWLELNSTKKGLVDKTMSQLWFESNADEEKYEVGAIYDRAIYGKKLESGQLLGWYHLMS